MENSIRVIKEWCEESNKHGLENYIADRIFEAEEDANIKTAKNLLKLNLSIDDIATATGLSKNIIESLQ